VLRCCRAGWISQVADGWGVRVTQRLLPSVGSALNGHLWWRQGSETTRDKWLKAAVEGSSGEKPGVSLLAGWLHDQQLQQHQ